MDETEREAAATIGYVAAFEYLNGFSKTIFWSREKMVNHADRYSPAFSKNATGGKYPKVSFDDYCAGNYPSSDAWKYSSFWYKDFDGMAYKTMLRQLISKWGVMSTELQTAFESDSEMEQNTDYVQAEEIQPPPQQETPMLEEPAPVESEAQVSLSDV
jgi:recombination protein RecT